MKITRLSIQNNRVTIVIILVLLLAGVSSYFTMPKAEDPGFTVRVAHVLTVFPGASPDRVESLVTDKIEHVIQEMPEVDFITSTSKTSVSSIKVNIKQSYTDLRPIWDKLRRKVSQINDLPSGVTPQVNDEYGDVFGIIVGLTGEGFNYAEIKEIADEVRDDLLHIPSAAKISISGEQEEKIYVEYKNEKLAELGLSTLQLQNTLQSTNIIFPGGDVRMGPERIALEPSGNFEELDDIRNTIINTTSGATYFLGDIAHVYRGYSDPPGSMVYINGQKGLALSISLKEGGNIIELGEAIENRIEILSEIYPIGIELKTIAYQHKIVDETVSGFVGNVIQSIAVVVAVMLLFLGLRTGLVIASLIPMAMVTTLFVMTLFNIGLDQVSLAALIIALGMLVDNAIVMAESIMVRMEKGEQRLEAAIHSASELSLPLLISSLTTSAAFLPIFLAESNVGEFTSSLFKVITISLLTSWILALTMIPLFCFLFLKVKSSKGSNQPSRIQDLYTRTLTRVLEKPIFFLGGIIICFLLAMVGFKKLPIIFFPPSERNLVTAEFELPEGTAIEYTDSILNQISAHIQHHLFEPEGSDPMVEGWAAWVGGGTPKYALSFNPPTPGPNQGYMLINTMHSEQNQAVIDHLMDFCQQSFPDLTPKISSLSSGPTAKYPIEIRVSGKDINTLYDIVESINQRLSTLSGTINIKDDWGPRTKKLSVDIDQARASNARLSSQDIAISLQTSLTGISTSEYRDGQNTLPIIMRNSYSDRRNIDNLENINVYAQLTGKTVPLSQVADINLNWHPSKILRRNRYMTMASTADLQGDITAAEINQQMAPWLADVSKSWPAGYTYEMGGETEESAKANESIMNKLPIAGLLIIILLVGQFNSIRKSTIVILTIPLGVIGVVGGLLITGSYFGFMTLLGIISLAGIVINNAIVLLDRIQLEQDEFGKPASTAIVDAAKQRFRPIMLTTATTVLGLIPLWLGGGAMWEPMAIGIIFGLLFATVITLLFVPAAYKILYRVS